MEFMVKSGQPQKQRTPCLIVGVFENKKLPYFAAQLDQAASGVITKLLKRGDFTGKLKTSTIIYDPPTVPCERILLVGCGQESALDNAQYQQIIGYLYDVVQQLNITEAVCYLTQLATKKRNLYWRLRFAVEAINDKRYQVTDFKQTAKLATIKRLILTVPSKAELPAGDQAIKDAISVAKARQLARYWTDLPANKATGSYLVEQMQKFAQQYSQLKLKVFDQDQLEQMHMHAILAVAKGSQEPAHLIQASYQGAGADTPPIVLIGKGVMFDAGGLCLKSAKNMPIMKMDMCGAATVLAVLQAAVQCQLPLNLIVLTPLVENMINGQALRPGDVIASHSGKTIEIGNTDAEGRLVLCDAISYALGLNPQEIIDVATLTGAAISALGYERTPLFSNRPALARQLLRAGEQAGDLAWQMPLDASYNRLIDSRLADMNNIGDGSAGSILAACFLQRFVGNIPWAHLDIAGTAMRSSGSTGRSVNLLLQYLMNK